MAIYISDKYKSWEKECLERFNKIKRNEERINERFIELYGLTGEICEKVADKDISVRLADIEKDIKSLLSYAVGCIFGRYSHEKDGIVFAGGNWDLNAYGKYMPDIDGILPITDEEYFSDDIIGKLCSWLEVVYGRESVEENLKFIASALGGTGASDRDIIRNYFIKDFYNDHCRVYQKTPIYWMIDSGKTNGFKALIYVHRYSSDTMGTVRTEYLHKTQNFIETAKRRAEYILESNTVSSEKSKAKKAIDKYTKQLAELKVFDEAIAHLANQRIEIDLDDGVKSNYEKFQGVEVSQEGKKALSIDILAKIK